MAKPKSAAQALPAPRAFLVEIGTEELPPKALARLSESFTAGIAAGLKQAGVPHGALSAYASPRRLAVQVADLAPAQPDRVNERRGPALNAAYDASGQPTRAALGFAQSCGVEFAALEKLETDKGAWLVHRARERGQPTPRLLPAIVQAALDQLPIPKRMRWGDRDVEFVRPVHWVVMLWGRDVIDCEILGQRAGRHTRGHRFLAPQPLALAEPAAYARTLEKQGRVLADFAARRERVRTLVEAEARRLKARAVVTDALLDEVTALVEWPVAVVGGFDADFLRVPPEALISTMQGNQKYFALTDAQGRLLPRFIAIANLPSRRPQSVQAGNERVIRPRFADAAFFWDQDRKQPLGAHGSRLAGVVFQHKLGTLADKTARVARLASAIAGRLGADPVASARAAELAKCDLMTAMVGEFPELQGIMGRYYAAADGEPAAIAQALEEQYRPRYAGDALPAGPLGQALALADKLDTLVGIFAIGQPPTGDKDPFALRRAALGVLRILIEGQLDLDLRVLLQQAAAGYPPALEAVRAVDPVFAYCIDRLRAYYADAGIGADTFEAVLATQPTRPVDFDRRLKAVTAFRALPEAASLAAANKRVRNILRQANVGATAPVDAARFADAEEGALHERVSALAGEVKPLLLDGQYTDALCRMAVLRAPVDAFFDKVMVMAEDPALRANRLALLGGMSDLFLQVADLSRLQG